MKYVYETHLHTREVSKCGVSAAKDYIAYYKELGFTGIFVTDHFFNGNCRVDRELPWEERVQQFCLGYELAKEEGDRQGIAVFFGLEYNYDCDEYLIYGIDKEWLLAHPEIMDWSHRELLENMHAAGAAVVQAHPYRVRDYIRTIHLHPEHVDGVEVFNKGNKQPNDALAYAYCSQLGLPMTAGSDIHWIPSDGSGAYGVAFDEPIESAADFARALREKRPHTLVAEAGREKLDPDYVPELPVCRYNYAGELI